MSQARLLHSEIILGENINKRGEDINNGFENPENLPQQLQQLGSGGVSENQKQESSGIGSNGSSSSGIEGKRQTSEQEQVRGEREIDESVEESENVNVDVEAKQEEEEEEEEYYDDIWEDYEYIEEFEVQVTKRPTVNFAR